MSIIQIHGYIMFYMLIFLYYFNNAHMESYPLEFNLLQMLLSSTDG